MRFQDVVITALAQIRANKLRSFFTLLGIIVSVAFLIAVVAIIQGMNAYVRENVAGAPLSHTPQAWSFDPNVALRRRAEFQQLHGYRGYALVERSGLGEDGFQEQRRQQLRARDSVPVPPERDWHP